jgi:arylsulfatase A-like enzyme
VRKLRRPLSALLTIALAACAGCTEPAGPPERPNVLLITIDTLRADRLSAWGYEKPTSPAIDRLAAESVVFVNAQSSSSWTLPSLASLLTSQHASTLDLWYYGEHLDPAFETLTERLAAAGYRTFGIGSHIYLGERFGLTQGFEEYDSELVLDQMPSQLAISSPRVTAKALAWLRAHGSGERPWLLWAHYFDPHSLYHPHPGISDAFGIESDSERYDGEIAFTDAAVGQLLVGLEQLGLAPNTIVALTADHGEEFEERGRTGHGFHVHQEVVHVPLIFRVPGAEPRRVETRVAHVDVLPTLLELTGLDADSELAGRSLVPALRGVPLEPVPTLSEVRLHGAEDSLSVGRWKLIRDHHARKIRLYDLAADPGERTNLAAEQPEIARELGVELGRRVQAAKAQGEAVERTPARSLTNEELERLRDLGYVE